MKKILLALMISVLSSTTFAEFTNMHAYSAMDDIDIEVIKSEIQRNRNQLRELDNSVANRAFDAPIHVAVKNQNMAVLEEIVKVREFIDIKNSYGQTALMIALREGFFDMAALLRESGASLNEIDSQGNKIEAYARVGNITVEDLENYISDRVVVDTTQGRRQESNERNTSETSSEQEQQATGLTLNQSRRITELERTIEGLFNLLNTNEASLEMVLSQREDVDQNINNLNNELRTLQSNVDRQSQILIPAVRSNIETINSLQGQVSQIDILMGQLSEREIEIDNIVTRVRENIDSDLEMLSARQNELEERYNIVEELREKIDQSAREIEEQQQNIENNINQSNNMGDFSDLNIQNDFTSTTTTTQQSTLDNIINEIMNNLMYILIGLLAIIIVIYILFKDKILNKVKNKKNNYKSNKKNEEIKEEQDFDDLPSENEMDKKEDNNELTSEDFEENSEEKTETEEDSFYNEDEDDDFNIFEDDDQNDNIDDLLDDKK